MQAIPIAGYPLERTYRTAKAAIEGAKNNPRQPKARADSARLAGATVVDACWTDTEFIVRFSNAMFLHIWVYPGQVQWKITDTQPDIAGSQVQRVGAAPMIFRWERAGDGCVDCSALVAKRRGAEFQQLFVNEFGLLVYLRGQLIWQFGVVRRTDTGQPILYVCEGD